MQPDERLERVRLLREQEQTPKQIARVLGIKPAEAARLVRSAAVLAHAEAPEPPLVGCWISPTWSTGLTFDDHPDWPVPEDLSAGTDGLVAVLVARKHRHGKVSVCGYLADVYCLGVKNALRPEIMDEVGLPGFVRQYFSSYHGGPLDAPVELARQVVFGSVEYARGLGFEPHPDFVAAEGHLGPWTRPAPSPSERMASRCTSRGPTTIRGRSSAPWNGPLEWGTSSSWRSPVRRADPVDHEARHTTV